MEETPLVDVLGLEHDVAVAAAARRGDNVLVEGKGDKDNDGEQVDGGAHGAHALGQLGLAGLAQVPAPEAGLDKGRAEPADHGVAEGEGDAGQGQRCYQRLAIAAEGVGEDGEGGAGNGEQRQGLAAGERRGRCALDSHDGLCLRKNSNSKGWL